MSSWVHRDSELEAHTNISALQMEPLKWEPECKQGLHNLDGGILHYQG